MDAPQPRTLDVERDMLDIGLYVHGMNRNQPLLVFGPVGEGCVFPDLEPGAGSATEEANMFLLFYAQRALIALGYCPDDMSIRQLVDPNARYDRDDDTRRKRAVFRMHMMGVCDDM